MPKTRLTEQREIFAREVVRIGVASRAYRVAYKLKPDIKPETVWAHASRLLADGKVKARIDELRAAAAAKVLISVEGQVHKLEQHRDGALEDGKWSAANQAVISQSRHVGLIEAKGSTQVNVLNAAAAVSTEVAVEEQGANDLARRIAFAMAKGLRESSKRASNLIERGK